MSDDSSSSSSYSSEYGSSDNAQSFQGEEIDSANEELSFLDAQLVKQDQLTFSNLEAMYAAIESMSSTKDGSTELVQYFINQGKAKTEEEAMVLVDDYIGSLQKSAKKITAARIVEIESQPNNGVEEGKETQTQRNSAFDSQTNREIKQTESARFKQLMDQFEEKPGKVPTMKFFEGSKFPKYHKDDESTNSQYSITLYRFIENINAGVPNVPKDSAEQTQLNDQQKLEELLLSVGQDQGGAPIPSANDDQPVVDENKSVNNEMPKEQQVVPAEESSVQPPEPEEKMKDQQPLVVVGVKRTRDERGNEEDKEIEELDDTKRKRPKV